VIFCCIFTVDFQSLLLAAGFDQGCSTGSFTLKPVNMKKHLLLIVTTMFMVGFLFTASKVISFSTGAPTNASGSPSNNNLTCVQCHASNNTEKFNWITSTELSQGYTPGANYAMQARAEKPGCQKFGFLLTIEKADGTKAGVPVATDAAKTQVVNTHYITHTLAGTVGLDNAEWNFQWTAPATAMGTVTLYGAFVGANGDNQNSGDNVYVSRKDVFLFGTQGVPYASASGTNVLYVYPNPVSNTLSVRLENRVESAVLTLYDLTGKKAQEIAWQSPILMKVDVSSLPEGVYLARLQWHDDQVTARVIVRR
jgi:hypothetical protein